MRRWILLGVATLGVLAVWTALVGAGTLEGWWRRPLAPQGDTAAFAAAADRMIAAESTGNLAFTLIEQGRPVHERFASKGAPVDRDTLFQVASLSKWITALGVMTLVDAGHIDLDAPVDTYLKRWKLPASEFDNRQVTVRRLLSHTAGLTDGLGYGGFAPGQPVQPLVESLTRAADASPHAEGAVKVGLQPGAGWKYSGGGYTLLQLLIEDVTGEPFAAYMRRAVLDPLGMTRSTFLLPEPWPANVAEIYGPGGTKAIHYRFTATGAASLYTSTADLTRLIAAQRPGPDGAPAGRGVLRPATLAEMRRPHAAQYGADIWGLGLVLYAPNNAGDFIVGHDGNNFPAINTAARFDPASGDGVVVLETGDDLLATRLAGEWVFWRTGHVDALTVLMEVKQTLIILAVGWGVILLGAGVLGWRLRRRGG
ncbi:MAG: serine hydrolase domain-containing protein [Phenylobacterium sp.]|uniref:serine hydrolase domain-containing protein n=1 Tax=Phenylobacterium sp. TaxID=1871053 RepID=UPI00272938B7|nr:serine hydrolase domain-containing protein [Phenylobacterium sp.]MDO8914009.1 serine hydrolase domain-containing protein [Phenylobacterium sp.]MDP3102699.1 serine hydrolase domain-containing protein [Phenylobacterium sp.]